MKRLLLIAASITFALLVAEGLARVFYHTPNSINVPQQVYDGRGPIPTPYQRGTITSFVTFSYTNNSLGFRGDREYAEKSKPRILLLGDSFTYGLGVNDDQTFAYLLERQLPDYEVINAGDPGQGTEYALKLYRTIGRGLHPDIVILSFCENDFADDTRHWYYDSQLQPVTLPDYVAHPRMTPSVWLRLHLRLAAIVSRVTSHYSVPVDESFTGAVLAALRDDVVRDGGRFYLFHIPDQRQPLETNQSAMLQTIGRRYGFQVKDFPTRAPEYLSDGHWNARGHDMAAHAIANEVRH